MDIPVDKYIEELFSEEATGKPSDTKQVDEFELPKWFDEKMFNRGRRFFWNFCFTLSATMMTGLVATLSVPSISRVLVNTYRSTTPYTAYKRYLSTYLHTLSWFEEELKPGSRSWKSLMTVRNRHFRAGQASKLKGVGGVSQRDLAITMFGFIGFSVLHPDRHRVVQLRDGDWEGYNHFWRTIGHMIGLEDRFNLCRKTIEETRVACQAVETRVFMPCLENVPEYYEHMARALLEGLVPVVPFLNVEAALFYTRYSAGVPGYIYEESDRIQLQRNIAKQLNGKPLDTGVDTASLMPPCAVEGLPSRPPRLIFYHDYDCLESSPAYKNLSSYGRFRLDSTLILINFYSTSFGRFLFNLLFRVNYFFLKYFPYNAFTTFGFKKSFVDMFQETPIDHTQPKLNAEYYKKDMESVSLPWYVSWIPKQYLTYFSYFINYRE